MKCIETICEKEYCTGCGACIYVCPKKCIRYEFDELDNIYPKIDGTKCVGCKKCRQVCPHLNQIKKNDIRKCYAAWSNNTNIRNESASGGIASELYYWAMKNKYKVIGTVWSEKKVVFKVAEKYEDIDEFRNSKYVFSNIGDTFKIVCELLKNKERVLFIGLPCQVAALSNFIKSNNMNTKQLLLVDLVCHGVVPNQYLISHIHSIEKKKGRHADNINFRSPIYHTNKFFFTLQDKNGIFYKKNPKSNDCYQIAYHKALAYRENCYYCEYACPKRCGDISLCDFTSVGKVEMFDYTNENISCVMINTDKGFEIWNEILNTGKVWAVKRPTEEITNYERQLKRPSRKHKNRDKFIKKYKETRNFTKAAQFALRLDIIWNLANYILPLRFFRNIKRKLVIDGEK